jgi:MoaA/NifB/PqqE/SkfB family radical SAM enzyme
MQTSAPGNNRTLPEENARLNEEEHRERRIVLESYPRSLFIQLDAPCNQDCLFCSRPSVYRHFDLDEYRRRFEDKLSPAIERAERLNLTGSGELLTLPGAKGILDYFNRFRHTEKMFATNGSSLTPKMVDVIAQSGNQYTIHISLHASTRDYHRVMANADTYDAVMGNLDYIRRAKQAMPKVRINFVFLATTKNIDNLADFISFAADYGADGVVVYYNYVYRLDQKFIHCYFEREKTNRMIDTARERAEYLAGQGRRLTVCLPPKFGQESYPAPDGMCGEPWSQVMVNPEGDIISCDVAGDSRENLLDKSFMDVWNGPYYRRIREFLASGTHACSQYCFRAHPAAVNDFRSHIITRGKSQADIDKFMEGA